MTSREGAEGSDVTEVLTEVLASPAGAERALPALLGALDAADRTVRLQASLGVCVVACATPETVEPLTWRLVDRLAGEAENLETRHALAYLRQRYPGRVRAVLRQITDAAEEREERARHLEISRGFARSDYYGQSDTNRDIGRTRVPGENGSGPRRIYREEGEAIGGPPAEATDREIADLLETVTAVDEADEETDSEAAKRRHRAEELERAAIGLELDDIAENSHFDDLALVALGQTGRYTTLYRTRAVVGTHEEGIALRTFDVPDDHADAFVADVGRALEAWASIDDHDLVGTVYDWGTEPRLWLATTYADETLYDRVDMSFDEGLWTGLKLTEALAHVHGSGVVHSGIDPYSVVYTGTTIAERPMPLLTNVGLLDAIRTYVEPSEYLDPRYAAPEYFDRNYGVVDHATDIYQLGAVLYYLVTGRSPYRGEYEAIRSGVLSSRPPAPTDLDPDIPDWVDEVVRKAMAKEKLRRYESATQFAGDLRRELGDDS